MIKLKIRLQGLLCPCFVQNNKLIDKGTRETLNRLLSSGNIVLVRMHTDGSISTRMVKELLWSVRPGCSIVGNNLHMTDGHFVLQMVCVMQGITDPQSLAKMLENDLHR